MQRPLERILGLNLLGWNGFDRSTNHRFDPTAAMILLFEHPAATSRRAGAKVEKRSLFFQGAFFAPSFARALLLDARVPNQPCGGPFSPPGPPASCSRCERPPDTSCWCVASRRVVWLTYVPLPPWPQLSACDGNDASTPCEIWDRSEPPSGRLPLAAFSESDCPVC